MRQVEIYGLYCPDTDELRYVGKAVNTKRRYSQHLRERLGHRPVSRWIKKLTEEGKTPVMRVLETVPHEQWEEAERRLIAQHRKTGKLLNLADGGATPSQTPEQRKNAARASNELQKTRPEAWKRFVRAKQDMARLYAKFSKDPRSYSHAARMRFWMRIDAAKDPELYGSWATL